MKTITFLTKTKQLYYHIKKCEHGSFMVYILLRKPTEIYYNKDKKTKSIKNVIGDCFVKNADVELVQKIMRSNTLAVQHLRNEGNNSIADLAQIKVNYGGCIKKWKKRWKIID